MEDNIRILAMIYRDKKSNLRLPKNYVLAEYPEVSFRESYLIFHARSLSKLQLNYYKY